MLFSQHPCQQRPGDKAPPPQDLAQQSSGMLLVGESVLDMRGREPSLLAQKRTQRPPIADLPCFHSSSLESTLTDY